MENTRLSTKGQVILPKGLRDLHAWGPGTEFEVEDTAEGVLLRPRASFPQRSLAEVAGFLQSKGKAKTEVEMKDAIAREVVRRSGRGRY